MEYFVVYILNKNYHFDTNDKYLQVTDNVKNNISVLFILVYFYFGYVIIHIKNNYINCANKYHLSYVSICIALNNNLLNTSWYE